MTSVAEGVPVPIPCPCCRRPVAIPTIDIVIDHYGIKPTEARILSAVWRGRGNAIPAAHIFEVMYAERACDRPEYKAMYSAFKVGLCHLRKRLVGSGISIENVGYAQGYRLALGE